MGQIAHAKTAIRQNDEHCGGIRRLGLSGVVGFAGVGLSVGLWVFEQQHNDEQAQQQAATAQNKPCEFSAQAWHIGQ